MKTAERKSESRNNHQFAAVVQDHYSADTIREKPKLHKRRRRISWKFSEPSQKPKVIHLDDLWEFGKYCEELSWNHRTAISYRLETRNCRTSCTSSKEGTSAVLLQSGIEWKVVVRFHEMLLLSARCPKTTGKREILTWTKIKGIIQRSEIKQEFINLERHYYEELYWLCFIRGRESGKKIFRLLRLRNWEIWRHWNTFQKNEHERSPDDPKRWRICISCGRWFRNKIRKRLRIPRTHSEVGIHRKERESQRRISWR